MQEVLVNFHNIFRWVVLVVAVAALVLAVMAATGRGGWSPAADRVSIFFTIAMDIQVLVGVIIWVIEQRWGTDAYLGWFHPILMLVAVAVAHIGRVRADRETADRDRGMQAALFFGGSLLLVLLAIPINHWPL